MALLLWLVAGPGFVGASTQVAAGPELARVTELVRAGDLDTAERTLVELLERGESPEARTLLGIVLARRGESAAAERELRRALELDPESATAYQSLGRLYLQGSRAPEAMAALRSAARLGPLDRELAYRLAQLELEGGEVAAGEERLRGIAWRDGSVRASLALARSLARRGENRRALDELTLALETAPESEEILSASARLLLAVDAPVPAIEMLEDLVRIHPSAAEYHYLLGVARLEIAENTTGIESLERSLELDSRQPLAYIALGLAYKQQNEFELAKRALQSALQLMPGNVDALVTLAEAEEGLGELELAEQHARRTLELAPDAPVALFVLGKIRMSQGRYEEARDALLRAVERDPFLTRAHYQLSLAYARLGDRERSRQHVELYREAREEEERRLIELRTAAGLDVERTG